MTTFAEKTAQRGWFENTPLRRERSKGDGVISNHPIISKKFLPNKKRE